MNCQDVSKQCQWILLSVSLVSKIDDNLNKTGDLYYDYKMACDSAAFKAKEKNKDKILFFVSS